jgi:hypothetical protein
MPTETTAARPWPGPKPQGLDTKRWTVIRSKLSVRDYRELRRVAEDLTDREGRRVYMSELIRRSIRGLCRAHEDGIEVLQGTPDALTVVFGEAAEDAA